MIKLSHFKINKQNFQFKSNKKNHKLRNLINKFKSQPNLSMRKTKLKWSNSRIKK